MDPLLLRLQEGIRNIYKHVSETQNFTISDFPPALCQIVDSLEQIMKQGCKHSSYFDFIMNLRSCDPESLGFFDGVLHISNAKHFKHSDERARIWILSSLNKGRTVEQLAKLVGDMRYISRSYKKTALLYDQENGQIMLDMLRGLSAIQFNVPLNPPSSTLRSLCACSLSPPSSAPATPSASTPVPSAAPSPASSAQAPQPQHARSRSSSLSSRRSSVHSRHSGHSQSISLPAHRGASPPPASPHAMGWVDGPSGSEETGGVSPAGASPTLSVGSSAVMSPFIMSLQSALAKKRTPGARSARRRAPISAPEYADQTMQYSSASVSVSLPPTPSSLTTDLGSPGPPLSLTRSRRRPPGCASPIGSPAPTLRAAHMRARNSPAPDTQAPVNHLPTPGSTLSRLLHRENYDPAKRHLSAQPAPEQDNPHCKACGAALPESTGLRCAYSGALYCTECHHNDRFVVPAKILQQWDFQEYPVSADAFRLLTELRTTPLFTAKSIAPRVKTRQKVIQTTAVLRRTLFSLAGILKECPRFDDEVALTLDDRAYMLDSAEVYSLQDFHDMDANVLQSFLKSCYEHFVKHIKECSMCRSKGHRCAKCGDEEPIFAFETRNVVQCQRCKAYFHRKCFSRTNCPGCLALRQQTDKQTS